MLTWAFRRERDEGEISYKSAEGKKGEKIEGKDFFINYNICIIFLAILFIYEPSCEKTLIYIHTLCMGR